MQKLMRNKGKKLDWNEEAQAAFGNIKREQCEAPVLGMPTEKGMYVIDTDASVEAISGILHQEQEWNGRTVLPPIAYGSKVLSDTEMKYGAPKAELFAAVTFVEKYGAYLGSAPFKLRVDKRALSWLKSYSIGMSYIGRWIVRLDGYHMIIEHRMRDKHQNADSLSKMTEFYERLEQKLEQKLEPQLYQTELLFRSLDQMGHQGIDKIYQRILKRFEWPGMKKACRKWVAACLSCQQVKDPRKLRFPLQSIESSEFNEVVQIDHQKICIIDSGYNQVLVMIDHFTKYAEAVPCITASAEETCDHLINSWIARHCFPMTFQSDIRSTFGGELTKELMRRSQVAQTYSTTYHPQTNCLVERQNRTLVSMLRVYCSRYMTDWDRYLPQVMGAYNSTQHSTTGNRPHMMLTGHEKSSPLTFFYPEYEGKKTSPQVT